MLPVARAQRVLDYLGGLERKTCWSGTAEDGDVLRLAWWTVWFAAFQEAANPYDAALRKVLGPRYRTYIQSRNVLQIPPPEKARAQPEVYDVDGRNGRQWVASVLAYLDWRSGLPWRPMADRNQPERRNYTEAALELRKAFYAPSLPPRTECASNVKAKSRAA